MRLKQFLICAALIGALALPAAFCEEEPPDTPIPATEAPATEAPATEVPSMEAPATENPSTEAPETEAPPTTEAPSTENPSTEAPSTEAPATAEPSPAPTDSAEPSLEPTETPSLAPTETPEATPRPTPDSAGDRVQIRAEGDARMENGVWRVRLSTPDGKLAFTWTVDGEVGGYLIYVQDGQGGLNFLAETASARMELNGRIICAGNTRCMWAHSLQTAAMLGARSPLKRRPNRWVFPAVWAAFMAAASAADPCSRRRSRAFGSRPAWR